MILFLLTATLGATPSPSNSTSTRPPSPFANVTNLPVQYSTESVKTNLLPNQPHYFQASLCEYALSEGTSVEVGIVLPYNRHWDKNLGVVYVDISAKEDWDTGYIGSNYVIEQGVPRFERTVTVNSTVFKENNVYIRVMPVMQIAIVSINVLPVESSTHPDSILPGPSPIPDRKTVQYEQLVPYTRAVSIQSVQQYKPALYRVKFCNRPYGDNVDWGIRSTVFAANEQSAFSTYLCSADIPSPSACTPGSKYVKYGGYNTDDSGINVVEVSTTRNPMMDWSGEDGFLLTVNAWGGAESGIDEFYLAITSFRATA